MFKKKKLRPVDRVIWSNTSNLFAMLEDIRIAQAYGAITKAEATELRHDICSTWGVLYQ